MECAMCGTDDELLYRCERCGGRFCATHHGRRYHECVGVTPSGRSPRERRPEPEVDRPAAQLFPDVVEPAATDASLSNRAASEPSAAKNADATAESPSSVVTEDTARPGYEPDRRPAEPEAPARTMREWFRRQTYVSLSVKVGLVATLLSTLVFAAIAVALYLPPA